MECKEGDVVKPEQILSILEAMKLEIPVKADGNLGEDVTVEKVLVKPQDVVDAGRPLVLLRVGKK